MKAYKNFPGRAPISEDAKAKAFAVMAITACNTIVRRGVGLGSCQRGYTTGAASFSFWSQYRIFAVSAVIGKAGIKIG